MWFVVGVPGAFGVPVPGGVWFVVGVPTAGLPTPGVFPAVPDGRVTPGLPVGRAGAGFGTLRVATRGWVILPPGAGTSACRRCTIATCCTCWACCLTCARAAGSRLTVLIAPPLAAAICDAGSNTWLLFTVLLFTTVFLLMLTLLVVELLLMVVFLVMLVTLLFVTFVTLVTLVTFWTMVFCCTSVRGGHGATPRQRSEKRFTWMLRKFGCSRCS
jgi:hypothetical protein